MLGMATPAGSEYWERQRPDDPTSEYLSLKSPLHPITGYADWPLWSFFYRVYLGPKGLAFLSLLFSVYSPFLTTTPTQ